MVKPVAFPLLIMHISHGRGCKIIVEWILILTHPVERGIHFVLIGSSLDCILIASHLYCMIVIEIQKFQNEYNCHRAINPTVAEIKL